MYHRRNVVNILLYIADQCKRYYPASEISNMLSVFLPLLTKDVSPILLTVLLWSFKEYSTSM
jgi:proteasome activator subunit 4